MQQNAELYKCKTIDFVWYDVMNELCGSNIAIGFYARRDKSSRTLVVNLIALTVTRMQRGI